MAVRWEVERGRVGKAMEDTGEAKKAQRRRQERRRGDHIGEQLKVSEGGDGKAEGRNEERGQERSVRGVGEEEQRGS